MNIETFIEKLRAIAAEHPKATVMQRLDHYVGHAGGITFEPNEHMPQGIIMLDEMLPTEEGYFDD